MKKFFSLFCPLFFLSCTLFGGCESEKNVFSLYEGGKYECTLSERNSYLLSDVGTVKEKIGTESGLLLALIGASWCPYCAGDIGPIDERFRNGALYEEIQKIYYIDVADSQLSTETVMDFNRTYDWSIRTRIPCLMAIKDKSLVAVITDEAFTQVSDRTERIDVFFAFLENMNVSKQHD